jgi:chemotaxis protein histidine kinase CheA/ActR/RegA family two-component response regulator
MPQPPGEWVVPQELRDSAEMREAFLDDALRCLQEMEQVAMDTSGDAVARCQSFCRQLHTIKGAGASVGLHALAAYLHDVEEWLSEVAASGGEPDESLLLAAVDSVRRQTDVLNGHNQNTAADSSPAGDRPTPTSSPAGSFSSGGGEQSVRIRAARLDRLMDMLADLLSIRNRREARLDEMARFNEELGRCAGRLRRLGDETSDWNGAPQRRRAASREDSSGIPGGEPSGRGVLDEVASDIAAIARELADTFQPLADENAALSQFIRHFRQELIQLRRLPAAGLFQRLRRAIHDAARAENKQVEIRLEGEDTGIEQAIQERLFEPLLHMVRNAVSHGIESPRDRSRARKSPHGTVTLSASASASMLTITVSDDGKGLDYDALRRRGFERGLLAPGSSPSPAQLARLIFHPGFSTRDSASQVSGRGVGMDVVATTMDRMQGRIDVDSRAGAGTSVQLSIPLTTGIEHVMVFRAGGDLYALPMRAVHSADRHSAHGVPAAMVRFAAAMGNEIPVRAETAGIHTLMFDDRLGLEIDGIPGPSEVVVRPLPEMLRHHPLASGVVFSSSGESVLLLNAERARQWCERFHDQSCKVATADAPPSQEVSSPPLRRALVVDDSLSARLLLSRKLVERGFEVSQAGDGLAALESLRTRQFDFVFTDIDMPRMGGLELLGEIRQDESLDVVTLVVSSRPRKEVWKRAARNGAAGFLAKPVSSETLDNLLHGLEPEVTSSPPSAREGQNN